MPNRPITQAVLCNIFSCLHAPKKKICPVATKKGLCEKYYFFLKTWLCFITTLGNGYDNREMTFLIGWPTF